MLIQERGIEPGRDGQHARGASGQHGDIFTHAVKDRLEQQAAQAVHQVAHGVDRGKNLEPVRHHRHRVQGVGGEEQRHGHELADAHHAFAGAHDGGDDHGKSREQGRPEHRQQDQEQDPVQAPLQMDAQERGQSQDDDELAEGAHRAGQHLAQHQGGTLNGRGQHFLQHPHVPFPDDGQAVENRDKGDGLRQDARCQKSQVADVACRDDAHVVESLPEEQQPQGRLQAARDDLGGVLENFQGLHLHDDPQVVNIHESLVVLFNRVGWQHACSSLRSASPLLRGLYGPSTG